MGADPLSIAAGSALIGGASSYFGNQAAAQGQAASAAALAAQKNTNTTNAQPYMGAGTNALGSYMSAIGLNGSGAQSGYYSGVGNVNNNPGYTGELNAGNTAIMKNAAAMGLSGPQANTMANIGNYSGNLANQFQQQQLSEIGGVMSQGNQSQEALAAANTNATAQQGQALGQQGIYQGASINGLGMAANQGAQNYLTYLAKVPGASNNANNNNSSASPVYYNNYTGTG